MKRIMPICQNTKVNSDSHEWTPCNFDDFLLELAHITKSCAGENPLPLFRGHADSKWLLDSTFARTCKRRLFDLSATQQINNNVKKSIVYHMVLLNLLFLKFGILAKPSSELRQLERDQDIDAWFELLRRCQQHPEDDHPQFKGTFILDWSKSQDVALYFANLNRNGDGALWICDAAATGETLQIKKVEAILNLMHEKGNSGNALGVPLIFYPKKQVQQQRANNQQAVYIAQMDLRYDLAEMWKAQEAERKDECIFIKLILSDGTQPECNEYLIGKGITEKLIFPTES